MSGRSLLVRSMLMLVGAFAAQPSIAGRWVCNGSGCQAVSSGNIGCSTIHVGEELYECSTYGSECVVAGGGGGIKDGWKARRAYEEDPSSHDARFFIVNVLLTRSEPLEKFLGGAGRTIDLGWHTPTLSELRRAVSEATGASNDQFEVLAHATLHGPMLNSMVYAVGADYLTQAASLENGEVRLRVRSEASANKQPYSALLNGRQILMTPHGGDREGFVLLSWAVVDDEESPDIAAAVTQGLHQFRGKFGRVGLRAVADKVSAAVRGRTWGQIKTSYR